MKRLAFIFLKLLKLKSALRLLGHRILITHLILMTALSNRCYYYARVQMRKLGFGEVVWLPWGLERWCGSPGVTLGLGPTWALPANAYLEANPSPPSLFPELAQAGVPAAWGEGVQVSTV